MRKRLGLTVVTLLFAALPAAAGATNWTHEGFSATGSGYNPSETILGAGNVDELEPDCTTSDPIDAPVLANGLLYGVSNADKRLYAIDAYTC